MAECYFVRWKGRVLGKYSLEQLKAMAKTGSFTPLHQVSSDNINWESLGSSGILVEKISVPPPIPLKMAVAPTANTAPKIAAPVPEPPSLSLNAWNRCPQCGNPLALGVRVCAVCHTDLRTGGPVRGAGQNGEEESGCLLWAAYIFALLFPLIGVILGIVVAARGRQVVHGILAIAIAIAVTIFWTRFWNAFWIELLSAI